MHSMLFTLLAQDPEVGGDTSGGSGVFSWQDMLAQLYDLVEAKGPELLLNVLLAAAILIFGRILARILCRRVVEPVMAKARIDETLVKFSSNLINVAMTAFLVMAAIETMGIETASLAALIAAAGLAVGFALQGSLANFASGVMIILFKPFKVGDYIEAAGTAGVVEEIQIFNTLMRTTDNKKIFIPNSKVTGDNITNFSGKTTRRIDLVIGCGYADDVLAVRQFLEGVIAADERVLDDPEPIVRLHELGDSSVDFIVRPWVNSEDYWECRWDLTEKIKLGFDEQGFTFPFPSRDVHLHNAA